MRTSAPGPWTCGWVVLMVACVPVERDCGWMDWSLAGWTPEVECTWVRFCCDDKYRCDLWAPDGSLYTEVSIDIPCQNCQFGLALEYHSDIRANVCGPGGTPSQYVVDTGAGE